jgi:hypothetical protein
MRFLEIGRARGKVVIAVGERVRRKVKEDSARKRNDQGSEDRSKVQYVTPDSKQNRNAVCVLRTPRTPLGVHGADGMMLDRQQHGADVGGAG